MGAIASRGILLKCKQNRVRVSLVSLAEVRVIDKTICLTTKDEVTTDLVLSMSLHGLLAVLLLTSDLLVSLMARHELSPDFLGISKVTLLDPGVGHDIRNGKTLMGVEVEHGGD